MPGAASVGGLFRYTSIFNCGRKFGSHASHMRTSFSAGVRVKNVRPPVLAAYFFF